MAADKTKSYEMAAKHAIEGARSILGRGWDHVSVDIKWGMVAAQIVGQMYTQDESVSGDAYRARLEAVTGLAMSLVGYTA